MWIAYTIGTLDLSCSIQTPLVTTYLPTYYSSPDTHLRRGAQARRRGHSSFHPDHYHWRPTLTPKSEASPAGHLILCLLRSFTRPVRLELGTIGVNSCQNLSEHTGSSRNMRCCHHHSLEHLTPRTLSLKRCGGTIKLDGKRGRYFGTKLRHDTGAKGDETNVLGCSSSNVPFFFLFFFSQTADEPENSSAIGRRACSQDRVSI